MNSNKLRNNLKNRIKMAAFDVDGTIMPFGNPEFSPGIKRMFKDLKSNNIYSIISTARDFVTIGNFLEQIPEANYFIGANGMFIFDNQNKKYLYENSIKLSDLIIFYESLFGKEIQYDENGKVKKFKDLESFTVPDMKYIYHSPQINKNTWFLTPHQNKLKPINFEEIDKEHIHIITLTSFNQEATDRLELYVSKIIKDNNLSLEVTSKWNKGIFVTPKNVTKYHALEILANHLNLSVSENMIAFGDSTNDYEMLENAAFSVGLGNHDPNIKIIADYHADLVENDGAYKALKDLNIL
ncbi:YcsE-related riboflavin metabolism phosphatase [Mycoplasma sp. 1018B]|uniref:YcsE-related riboflavin metabolism phosphatase n=1 Tax=Mycoplasma sp. 1018B TaxID=2967302 RepID=UPI00211CBCF0|nr:HAD family hydrolase [Mycoplasma sp. 1018B]UUM19046.1 Cof-type HAD-IIB family hydrolase [Mycoplasma sp. 1018B]